MEEYIPSEIPDLGSNGLNDFKVALYVYPIHTDDGIYSDHGYLDTFRPVQFACPTSGTNEFDPRTFPF